MPIRKEENMKRVLVTGAAGFIGFHLCRELLARGYDVTGLDSLNAYYDVSLKEARLHELLALPGNFRFERMDIVDAAAVECLFSSGRFDCVLHMAAQAGVRYSIENPGVYTASNVSGFLNVLEGCHRHGVKHLIYASSSSVYGNSATIPFVENDPAVNPVSLYAATKRSGELMAQVYSRIHGLPTTGLRFFTVYGPWGRPDMAPMLFAHALLHNEPLRLFNHGKMWRDFTYVADIVHGILLLMERVPGSAPDPGSIPGAEDIPASIYNIGHGNPVELGRFVEILEQALGRKGHVELLPMQPGDVVTTYADTTRLHQATGFTPSVSLEEGVERFAAWLLGYMKTTGHIEC